MLQLSDIDNHQSPLKEQPPATDVGDTDDRPPGAGDEPVKRQNGPDGGKTPQRLLEGKLLLRLIRNDDRETDRQASGTNRRPDHANAQLRQGAAIPLRLRKLLDERAEPSKLVIGNELAEFFDHGGRS